MMSAPAMNEMIVFIQKALLKGKQTAPGVYDPITERKLLRRLKIDKGSQALLIESPRTLDRPMSAVKITAPVERL